MKKKLDKFYLLIYLTQIFWVQENKSIKFFKIKISTKIYLNY